MTSAQFEDAEGRALVEAIHQRKRWAAGTPILYWPGVKHPNYPGRPGVIISDGVVKFCGTDCVRVETMEKGTDYIAVTHIEARP